MATNEVQLQFAQLRRFDRNVRQSPKTRIDTVNCATFSDYLLHDSPGFFNARSRHRRQRYSLSTIGHIRNLLKTESLTV